MRPSFNVLNDPWIPVVAQDGERSLLGIRETLRRASELKEISVVSPLEEFSVYRFLSVFLLDALRPKRGPTIKKLLRQGFFDMEQIEAYISLCEEEGVSFDLFDEQRPFMQAAYVKEWDKEPESVGRLDFAQPNGNNHTHFVHSSKEKYKLSFAEALPKILVANLFAVNGGRGYQPGINSVKGKNPYLIMINGENLFQTLCFLLLPVSEHDYGNAVYGEWMTVPESAHRDIPDLSFFRMMIYPVRSILLKVSESDEYVESVFFGEGYAKPSEGVWRDPNVAYSVDKRLPIIPEMDVELWRNYMELFRKSGRPEVLARFDKYDIDRENIGITVYGLYSENANFSNTIRASLCIPRMLLVNEEYESTIEYCIQTSNIIGNKLKQSLRVALKNEKAKAKRKELKQADAKSKEVASLYYSNCEKLFWDMIRSLEQSKMEELHQLQSKWKDDVWKIAKREYEAAVSSIQANGRTLRQIALGEDILRNWSKPKGGKKR